MDREEAEQRYQQAAALFQAGRPGEALAILDRLDSAFPNLPRIMYARAECLAQLGKTDQAARVCDVLIHQHNHERAHALRERLGAQVPDMDSGLNFVTIDDLLGPDTAPPRPRTPVKAGPDWGKWALVACGVIVVVAILAVPLFYRGSSTSRPAPAPREVVTIEQVEAGEATVWEYIISQRSGGEWTLLFIIGWVLTVFAPVYVLLRLLGKLPYDDFMSDLLHVGGYATLCYLLMCTCIGIIPAIIIMMRVYDLRGVEILMLLGIAIGFGIVNQIVTFVVFG